MIPFLDVDVRQQDRDGRELAEIGAALQRLAAGSYGTCVDCGRDIGAAGGAAGCRALHRCARRRERGCSHEQGSTL